MPLVTRNAVNIVGQASNAVAHTGNTTETTLATVTIPAGSIGANGRIEIEALFSHTNSANNKTLRIRFNGSNINQTIATTTGTNRVAHMIANRGVTNSQVHFTMIGTTSSAAPLTVAEDTTADVTITFTGTLANSAETVTLESYTVRVYPKG